MLSFSGEGFVSFKSAKSGTDTQFAPQPGDTSSKPGQQTPGGTGPAPQSPDDGGKTNTPPSDGNTDPDLQDESSGSSEIKALYDKAYKEYTEQKEKLEKAEKALTEAERKYKSVSEQLNDLNSELKETQNSITSLNKEISSSESTLVYYVDRSDLTVTVELDQYDVTEIAIGDKVIIYSSETGMTNGKITAIAAVNIGDVVDISFLAYPDQLFEGYVSEIGSSSSSGKSSTVSYPVTVVVTTVLEKMLSGMTANVTFISKKVQDVLYVSNKAVITEGADSYVLRQNADGTEEKVKGNTAQPAADALNSYA